jgi:hypothetical protein
MKLNVQERLILVHIVPTKATFEVHKMIEEMKEMLYPSEEETKKFAIKQEEKTISWNAEGSAGTEIKLTTGMITLIKKQFDILSKGEELEYPQYLLYKRFKTKK